MAVAAEPASVGLAIVASPSVAEKVAPRMELAVAADGRPSMMPTEKASPIVYRGCKIYSSPARRAWRVYPFPVDSVYDKAFYWSAGAEAQWQRLLAYCENPTLPKSRMKDVAKCK